MKILHMNYSENSGGAGLAANRLHQGMRKAGLESRMLVYAKKTDDWSVYGPSRKSERYLYHMNTICNTLPLKLYSSRKQTPFSPAITTNVDFKKINEFDPDIVHLHWLGKGFFSIEDLKKICRPIIWTLHDMWPFTGGCFYDEGCGKFQVFCGACPQLVSRRRHDLSHKVLMRKLRYWKNIEFTLASPSNWLADRAKKSYLFRGRDIHVIPNGLDLDSFKPMDKLGARRLWSLSPEKKYILFGAVNPTNRARKGFDILHQVLKLLSRNEDRENIELVIFGATEPEIPDNYGFQMNYMGELHGDVSLVSLYSAVDVFLAPSRQDNLPNTVLEAMSCALPVVTFDIGGMPDMIDHMKNGYLARPFSPEDFVNGIKWILENNQRYQQLSLSARQKVENSFEITMSIEQYTKIYQSLITNACV